MAISSALADGNLGDGNLADGTLALISACCLRARRGCLVHRDARGPCDEENGTDPEEMLNFEQRLAAVTPAEVAQAAQRYFDLQNYVQVVLYPQQ